MLAFICCVFFVVNNAQQSSQMDGQVSNPTDSESQKIPTVQTQSIAQDPVLSIIDGKNAEKAIHNHKHETLSPQVIIHGSHTHTLEDTQKNSGYIFGVMLGVMVGAQTGIYIWKTKHPSSFHNVTLLGLWIIPFIWCIALGFWRMLLVWSFFTFATGYFMVLATRRPLKRTTPRRVYGWFYLIYKFCMTIGLAGYAIAMFDVIGFLTIFRGYISGTTGWMMLFYGLYYGVLGRDCASFCASYMASTMGYSDKSGFPSRQLAVNVCAICDGPMTRKEIPEDSNEEKVLPLNCGHWFHEFCLRGWLLIGKRDTCAYCNEKVNLSDKQLGLLKHHWDKHAASFSVILDSLRYLIVFNPLIILLMHFVLQWVY